MKYITTICLSHADITRLMFRFDPEDLQRFNVKELCKFIRGPSEDEKEPAERRRLVKDDDDFEPDESSQWLALKKAVKKKILSGLSSNEIFSLFDSENRTVLDVQSLHAGAGEIGVTMTRAEARAILRRMYLVVDAVDRKSFLTALGLDENSRDNSDRTSTSRRRVADDDYDDEDHLR